MSTPPGDHSDLTLPSGEYDQGNIEPQEMQLSTTPRQKEKKEKKKSEKSDKLSKKRVRDECLDQKVDHPPPKRAKETPLPSASSLLGSVSSHTPFPQPFPATQQAKNDEGKVRRFDAVVGNWPVHASCPIYPQVDFDTIAPDGQDTQCTRVTSQAMTLNPAIPLDLKQLLDEARSLLLTLQTTSSSPSMPLLSSCISPQTPFVSSNGIPVTLAPWTWEAPSTLHLSLSHTYPIRDYEIDAFVTAFRKQMALPQVSVSNIGGFRDEDKRALSGDEEEDGVRREKQHVGLQVILKNIEFYRNDPGTRYFAAFQIHDMTPTSRVCDAAKDGANIVALNNNHHKGKDEEECVVGNEPKCFQPIRSLISCINGMCSLALLL